MYEMELTRALFQVSKEEPIKLTGSAQKTIGTFAPAGVGLSKSHSGRTAAKYSAVGKALDYILLDNSVKCLEADNSVYVEYFDGTKSAKVLCDGVSDSYEGERLHRSAKFIPLIL